MIPERIGKYAVIELLGRGGMGEVYLAEDPYIGRRVAIKIIKGADPAARERFLREARVIGGLTHPAIVSLLDFDFSGSEPFLVMEYLKGQGLDVWIKNPHSISEQLVVLEDLCHALTYAHENGVLHRDVKPSNVQILPSGHAKLMDFGIASAAAQRLTATGSVMGTPEYMAPEILGDGAYSTRSDLYAAAVLFYEVYTGKNPFAAKTVAATLTNVLSLNPPDIRVANPELPKRLAETLMACLHKNPELRPDDFAVLLTASREAVGGTPVRAAIPETRAIPTIPAAGPATGTALAGPPAQPPGTAARVRVGAAGLIVILGSIWALDRGGPPRGPSAPIAPGPGAAATTPSIQPDPSAVPTRSPTPENVAPPAEAVRQPSEPRGRVAATPTRSELVSAATPMATAAPSPAPLVPLSTPQPRALPPSEAVPTPTPSPTPPAPASVTAPVVSGVFPRTVRRGSSVDLEIRGEGLRKELKAEVLQGRRPADGIRVLRQEFVSSGIIRVRILIEAETPLLTYSIVFQDAGSVVTAGVQIEVVL